jgi:Tat protein secretion system quality control protein TatD with DNase activity
MSTRPTDQSLVEQFALDNQGHVIPFYGYHPWFAYFFSLEGNPTKETHYTNILTPAPTQDFVSHLPDPLPWSDALSQLRRRLERDHTAQVGEIGLDKSFRLPKQHQGERDIAGRRELSVYRIKMEHQRRIFMDQVLLAGEMGRGISVHSVQCHGIVLECFQGLWRGHEKPSKKKSQKGERNGGRGGTSRHDENDDEKNGDTRNQETENGEMEYDQKPGTGERNNIMSDTNDEKTQSSFYPPRICLHSTSISPSTLSAYLNPSIPSQIFFSFSLVINARYGQKLLDLLSLVPAQRILIESDLHMEGGTRWSLLEAIARIVIRTKGWTVEDGVTRLEGNFEAFLGGERAGRGE